MIKLVECKGKPVAKLSDSPGKTICQDQAFVRALRKAFDLPLVKKPAEPSLYKERKPARFTRRLFCFYPERPLFSQPR